MRAIGMSPSPGTSRCGRRERADLEVAHLHEPDAVDAVADRRGEAALGPARVDLHAHADVEPAGEVDRVAQRVHEPDVDAQRVRVLDRERDVRARGLRRAPARARPRARRPPPPTTSGANGPVVNTRHSAPTAAAVSSDAQQSLLLRRPTAPGSARWNGPSPMRFADAQPARDRVGDERGARRPSRTLRASRPTRRRGRCRAASQNARSSASERPERRDRAHAHARVHRASRA